MQCCALCGQVTAEDARFCPACGGRLTAALATSRLARKTVTVLFSDVSGFTALGERLDPESVHQVMRRFFTEMGGVVERHGGTIEKFMGDEVMALFGVPVLHEDDVLRAARAALEMRTVLEVLNEELASRWDIRLSAHTGLNTGDVVAGMRAEGEGLTYGDAINVAQRLEAAAAPGEILVGATTARLLRGRARLTAIAPLRLKGKSNLIDAWRLDEVDVDSRPGAPVAPTRPLVGRRAELSWLRDTFDAVVESRHPQLVTLVGSAGIGKSRLARALLDETAERATVVVGHCLPYGEGITYWPLTEIVRRLAERPDEAAIAELAGGGAEGARVASRVARAVGFSPGSVAVEEAHWAVRRLLEIQAARRPLIVAIDDLHWAEPTLLDLIEQLATSTADVPLLAVFLARPELLERRPDWGELGARSTVVPLGPLGADEAAALVERLSGEAVEPDERDVLLARAEGNPFFLEQMVARRAETGVVSAGLPETIQALLAARIDSLSPAERAVVDRAAIEGRTFHRGAVAELLPSDERAVLDAGLAALVRRQLIRQSEAELPGEVGYRFGHALVRDVAYELLAKTMRADLHEAYATWLEHQVDGYAEIVGYHLEQAHRCHAELHPGADAERRPLARRAATRLGTAGRAAVDRGDLPGGVNLLRRATTLLPDDEPARGMLVPELGIALVQLGRLSEADDVLTAAAGRAGADNEKVAEAHALIARFFARVQVDSKAAAAELNERFEAFEDAFANAGDELGLTRLWRARALVHWIAGQSTQAESAWERAVTYARRAGDEQGRTEALAWLASAACEGPTPVTEAIPRCEAILEQLQADRRSQAHTMRPLASLHAMAGSLDRSRELFDRANAILHDLGVGLTSAAPQDEAFVAMLVGDATAAETALRHGYQRLSEMGERALLATTAAMLAQALYLQGRLDEALEFAEAAQAAAAVDDLSAQILARTARAQVLGCRGDTTAADRLSGEAVALALQTDWLNYQADTLMVRAAVLRAADEPEQAATAVRAAVGLYERKGNVMAADRARAAVTDDLNQTVRLKRSRKK